MTLADPVPPRCADAALAAALFCIDPAGLGGVALRGGHGPLQDEWIAAVRAMLPQAAPVVRVPLNVSDDRLDGAVDLAASLAAGRLERQPSLLDGIDGGVAILPMAERLEGALGARLVAVLDRSQAGPAAHPAFGLIALDEGRTPEERPPAALLDRLAFLIDLTDGVSRDDRIAPVDGETLARARNRLPQVAAPDDELVTAMCDVALAFGVPSLRSVILALKVARAHAALSGRPAIGPADVAAAARLVLAPRATQAPAVPRQDTTGQDSAEQDATPPEPSPAEPDPDTAEAEPPADTPGTLSREAVEEILVAALRAMLPDFVDPPERRPVRPRLADVGAGGGGARTLSLRRGRPIAARAGALGGGARLDLVATLRAAAPWQRLRAANGDAPRLALRKNDIRIRRFVQRAELTTVFVVDASGSTAFQRLAEAKGAVEQLLARAYVSRARVAMIAFHHAQASLLLPPTRSLTRAKRLLAELPGGGGTPLSRAIDASLTLALSERRKQRTPMLVFLTDGRANIDGQGEAGRTLADRDALAAAQKVGLAGVRTLYIDTSVRAQPDADRFARAMGGSYALLPFVESRAVADLVMRESQLATA